MSKENTYYWPSKNKNQSFSFPALNGGLNLRDAEINLSPNESSDIQNLWVHDGVLQSRPGQVAATSGWGAGSASGQAFGDADTVYAATEFPEGVIVHIGAALYAWYGDLQELRQLTRYAPPLSVPGSMQVPRNAGNFFHFGDVLYYKNAGGFYKLERNKGDAFNESPFTVSAVTNDAFTPTILINADPDTGSGDTYQPENRLSPCKCVTYNAKTRTNKVEKTGNGVSRMFSLGATLRNGLNGLSSVTIDGVTAPESSYSLEPRTGTVIFKEAPAKDAAIVFTMDIGYKDYHLPVKEIDSVVSVKLWSGGFPVTLTAGFDYSVNAADGIVTFRDSPPVTDPPTNNTVEITYSKANPDAMSAVMNCPYAAVYGTGRDLCVIAGGGSNQTNAVFWSGSTQYGLDPSYWPMSQYNFTDGEITGFATQYDQMFVFQERKIGKLDMTTEEVNERAVMSLTYTSVNDKIGCDIPQSIQLIENNLTFANSSGGVYQILSSSAAYENNIQCLSEKINGSNERPGLLYDLRVSDSGTVRSLDDGRHYWLSVNGHVWVWDYSLTENENPVWFYFTGMSPLAFSMRDGEPCLFDGENRAVRLSNQVFSDFGDTPIRKVYQFPVQNFGGYDRLKDIRSVLLSFRADTPSDVDIIYETDYETRADRVSMSVRGGTRLTERNLEVRDLSVPRHAAAFRRNPRCGHVRHFSMRLENNVAGQNLAPYSAEIQIRYVGRER